MAAKEKGYKSIWTRKETICERGLKASKAEYFTWNEFTYCKHIVNISHEMKCTY